MSLAIGPGVIDWMRANSSEYRAKEAIGIGWKVRGRIVAGVAYTDFNGPNLCMHVVAEGRRWLTREYLWTCFDYPFNQCKVRRVTGLVGEGNLASRKFTEHLGFSLETTLEDAHPTGKLLVYRMKRAECKWISQGFSKQLAKAA